jgi:hypothetical protein
MHNIGIDPDRDQHLFFDVTLASVQDLTVFSTASHVPDAKATVSIECTWWIAIREF